MPACLGVLAVVPGPPLAGGAGPVRRIKPRHVGLAGGRASAGAGCLRRSVCLGHPATRLSTVAVVWCAGDPPAGAQAAAAARTPGTSTRMPGPIVLAIVRVLQVLALGAARAWPG